MHPNLPRVGAVEAEMGRGFIMNATKDAMSRRAYVAFVKVLTIWHVILSS